MGVGQQIGDALVLCRGRSIGRKNILGVVMGSGYMQK